MGLVLKITTALQKGPKLPVPAYNLVSNNGLSVVLIGHLSSRRVVRAVSIGGSKLLIG